MYVITAPRALPRASSFQFYLVTVAILSNLRIHSKKQVGGTIKCRNVIYKGIISILLLNLLYVSQSMCCFSLCLMLPVQQVYQLIIDCHHTVFEMTSSFSKIVIGTVWIREAITIIFAISITTRITGGPMPPWRDCCLYLSIDPKVVSTTVTHTWIPWRAFIITWMITSLSSTYWGSMCPITTFIAGSISSHRGVIILGDISPCVVHI